MRKKIKLFIDQHKLWADSFVSFIISLLLLIPLYFWHSNPTLIGWVNITFGSSMILICIGLLIYIAQEGTFNYLVFSLKSFGRLFIRGGKNETYLEYIERKSKREKVPHMGLILGSLPLLFTSIVLMMILFI